jgi:transposase
VDSSAVRAHQHAAGACRRPAGEQPVKGGIAESGETDREALGRSRGGLTTKVHLAADLRCRPIATTLTGGHRHDCTAFDTVMAGIRIHRFGPGRPRTRPATCSQTGAYANRGIRTHLRRTWDRRDHPGQRRPAGCPAAQGFTWRPAAHLRRRRYRQRNAAERCINKLKQFRAVATRYDKRRYMYRATVDIATTKIWLRDRTRGRSAHDHRRD